MWYIKIDEQERTDNLTGDAMTSRRYVPAEKVE